MRGQLTIEDLAVHRDDAVGHLALDVHEVRCELAAFGAALIDRSCRDLAVRGVRLEVSSRRCSIACMPRTQLLRRMMSRSRESARIQDDEFVSALLDRGELAGQARGHFTEGYGVRPEEVAGYFTGHGLSAIELRALKGSAVPSKPT